MLLDTPADTGLVAPARVGRTIVLALPGAGIVGWEALRGGARTPVPR